MKHNSSHLAMGKKKSKKKAFDDESASEKSKNMMIPYKAGQDGVVDPQLLDLDESQLILRWWTHGCHVYC